MSTIKLGWYRHHAGYIVRLLGSHPDNKDLVSVERKFGHKSYQLDYVWLSNLEHLPDCTGFDWEPPPKYLPYKNVVDVPRTELFKKKGTYFYYPVSGLYLDAKMVKIDTEWITLLTLFQEYETLDGKPAGMVQ